jgi:23S rRNA (adenine2503-C2)-methyltransferase
MSRSSGLAGSFMAPCIDLKDLAFPELEAFVARLGERRFRAVQIFRWIQKRGARSFEEMTDLPAALRQELPGCAEIGSAVVEHVQESTDGTRKILLRLQDGLAVESVLIPDEKRLTLCLSTQVGCALGCAFCATATMGLRRHLRPGEIVEQVLRAGELCGGARKVSNLVLMGMGEPLHNYEHTLKALRILTDPNGLHFSPRRITLSTVGLIPEMLRLGREIPVKLAVSLHAADDETRGRLMPINKKYSLEALVEACRAFPRPERLRITFEYVLLRGVNVAVKDADRLGRLLRGLPAKVNLIPYNPHPGAPFERPSDEEVAAFQHRLLSHNIPVMVRAPRGQDIAAACGQLCVQAESKSRAGGAGPG